MPTLLIRDLPATATLDRKSMSAVRGGLGYIPSWTAVYAPVSTENKNIAAEQFVGQSQFSEVANGVNVAFADHLKTRATIDQFGQNNITQY